MYEVSTLEKDTKICTVTGSTKKAFFSEILSQDMSSSCFPPKNKLLISRPVRSANQKHGFLAGNSLNSCPDLGLRKKLTLGYFFMSNLPDVMVVVQFSSL